MSGQTGRQTCVLHEAIRRRSQPAVHQIIPQHLEATLLYRLPCDLFISAKKPEAQCCTSILQRMFQCDPFESHARQLGSSGGQPNFQLYTDGR